MSYLGRIPLRSRWSLRRSGCAPLRFAAALRSPPDGRLAPIPCALLPRLDGAPPQTANGSGSARERRSQPLPMPTARPASRWSASLSPPPDTRKPQKHRQRSAQPFVGRPAAPTARPHSGPPHSAPGGRASHEPAHARLPGAPFSRPLSVPIRQRLSYPSTYSEQAGAAVSTVPKPGRGMKRRRLQKQQQRPLAECGALRAGFHWGGPQAPVLPSASLWAASASATGKRLLHPHEVPFGRVVRLCAHRGPHGRPPLPLAESI